MLRLFKSRRKTRRAKILVVDDEPDLVEMIQRRLVPYGWKIITSANGREGLERAANEKPDLIVLDINMPVMNGHEMLDCLRRDPDLNGTPVIMCTMSDQMQDITKASSYNICGYVTKPLDGTELPARITEILENRASD